MANATRPAAWQGRRLAPRSAIIRPAVGHPEKPSLRAVNRPERCGRSSIYAPTPTWFGELPVKKTWEAGVATAHGHPDRTFGLTDVGSLHVHPHCRQVARRRVRIRTSCRGGNWPPSLSRNIGLRGYHLHFQENRREPVAFSPLQRTPGLRLWIGPHLELADRHDFAAVAQPQRRDALLLAIRAEARNELHLQRGGARDRRPTVPVEKLTCTRYLPGFAFLSENSSGPLR